MRKALVANRAPRKLGSLWHASGTTPSDWSSPAMALSWTVSAIKRKGERLRSCGFENRSPAGTHHA
jgi:hypothetical protein